MRLLLLVELAAALAIAACCSGCVTKDPFIDGAMNDQITIHRQNMASMPGPLTGADLARLKSARAAQ